MAVVTGCLVPSTKLGVGREYPQGLRCLVAIHSATDPEMKHHVLRTALYGALGSLPLLQQYVITEMTTL